MLILKQSPVGIDFLIQELQKHFHTELMAAWGLDELNTAQNKLYECYGRCYRNKTESGYTAQVFDQANDYKDVYWNDKLNALSFFGIGNTETHKAGEKTTVHLVLFVNLKNIKPSITHRADEEVRRDVQLIARDGSYGFVYTSTELWLENVLKEYSGSYRDERLKAVDMQPVHCFRINFEINYSKEIC